MWNIDIIYCIIYSFRTNDEGLLREISPLKEDATVFGLGCPILILVEYKQNIALAISNFVYFK